MVKTAPGSSKRHADKRLLSNSPGAKHATIANAAPPSQHQQPVVVVSGGSAYKPKPGGGGNGADKLSHSRFSLPVKETGLTFLAALCKESHIRRGLDAIGTKIALDNPLRPGAVPYPLEALGETLVLGASLAISEALQVHRRISQAFVAWRERLGSNGSADALSAPEAFSCSPADRELLSVCARVVNEAVPMLSPVTLLTHSETQFMASVVARLVSLKRGHSLFKLLRPCRTMPAAEAVLGARVSPMSVGSIEKIPRVVTELVAEAGAAVDRRLAISSGAFVARGSERARFLVSLLAVTEFFGLTPHLRASRSITSSSATGAGPSASDAHVEAEHVTTLVPSPHDLPAPYAPRPHQYASLQAELGDLLDAHCLWGIALGEADHVAQILASGAEGAAATAAQELATQRRSGDRWSAELFAAEKAACGSGCARSAEHCCEWWAQARQDNEGARAGRVVKLTELSAIGCVRPTLPPGTKLFAAVFACLSPAAVAEALGESGAPPRYMVSCVVELTVQ